MPGYKRNYGGKKGNSNSKKTKKFSSKKKKYNLVTSESGEETDNSQTLDANDQEEEADLWEDTDSNSETNENQTGEETPGFQALNTDQQYIKVGESSSSCITVTHQTTDQSAVKPESSIHVDTSEDKSELVTQNGDSLSNKTDINSRGDVDSTKRRAIGTELEYMSSESSSNQLNSVNLNSNSDSARPNYPKNISNTNQCTQADLYGYGISEAKFSQKMYSEDGREYIKMKHKNDQFFYSSKFIEKVSETEITIRVHGSENLLTLNKDNFVARIEVLDKNMLNFRECFQTIKLEYLNKIIITNIYEDGSLERRNECYRRFKDILQKRVSNSTDDVDCTEDLLQLSNIYNQTVKRMRILDNKTILNKIIENKYISVSLKELTEQLLSTENELSGRNNYLPKFSQSASPTINDISIVLYEIYKFGVSNHKNSLVKKYPYHKFKFMFQLLDINYLPDIIILALSGKDIKLFTELVTFVNQQKESSGATCPLDFIISRWENFYTKIKRIPKYESIKQLGSLTNPIYLFLFKSFCEVITEISEIIGIPTQDLLKYENGKFSTLNSLNWPENAPINRALEQQYHIIFKLMEHYEPGKYSNKVSFKYALQLTGVQNNAIPQMFIPENVPEERLVWLYILDSGLAHIVSDGNVNVNIGTLAYSLQEVLTKFLEKAQHDRFESFRIVVHNITKLVAHVSTYIFKMGSTESEIDHEILDKQINIVRHILSVENDNDIISHFAILVDIYKEYWKNRESIVGKILSKCPCKQFENVMKENIFLRLLEIVNKALCKCVTTQAIINFFRLYNEFLQHFKGLEFEWLVSEKSLPDKISKKHLTIIDKDKRYYRVENPEQFIMTLKTNEACIPEHYLITIVMELLCIVSKSLDKQNWSDSDQLNVAGDIFLAIGHSLVHFKNQANYVDFDNFVRNFTFPFSDVIKNSKTYIEFKDRLEKVKNFYLYTNKQKEISIETALKLYVKNSRANVNKDFVTGIDERILKDCYTKYSTKYSSLENYLEISDIHSIIEDMRKDLVNISCINDWTPDFKQNVIPPILANLAAVWTILESKDLASIGKRIEPHIIQILCVLRLLGVDKKTNGIDKHLAEILTGQGKSIVLGLLSSLLAVTGNESVIACYSEYLANRDKDAFKKYFVALKDFNVASKVDYKTIDDTVNAFLYVNINGSERPLRGLVSDLIFDKLPLRIIASDRESKSSILLIDEVDVFFSEKFYGGEYSPIIRISIPALLKIQPKIWEIVEEGLQEKGLILERVLEFINELLKDDKYEDFKIFMENTKDLFKKHLEIMVTTAINVSKTNKNTDSYRYKIDTRGQITYRNNDGMYVTNISIDYHNTFNYFLLKETEYDDKNCHNYGSLIVDCGCISYANLPNEFPMILGVSGTLTNLCDFEKAAIKSYGINVLSVMPSFFGDSKLRFNPSLDCILNSTESEWLDCIYNSVNDKIQHGRAVMVFFETRREMNLFDMKYRSKIDRLHTLTGNEEPSTLEWRINESGVTKTVTLATRLMGRGVDFQSNDFSVEEKGGVHVIQSFFSLDVKEEVQIKGRTARKDNKGSYELILCHKQLAEINCLKKANGKEVAGYNELCAVRKTIADSRGALVKEKIKQAAKKHDLTMQFMKSFADYTTSKRTDYFLRYPFAEPEDEK